MLAGGSAMQQGVAVQQLCNVTLAGERFMFVAWSSVPCRSAWASKKLTLLVDMSKKDPAKHHRLLQVLQSSHSSVF